MRHRRKGRKLGRNPSHQRALLKNLASALILTERDAEFDDNEPKVKGRIITTMQKAKEVRPYVEKCVTMARKAQTFLRAAEKLESGAERGTDAWTKWRQGDGWQQWNNAISPSVALRRRALRMLGSKEAVSILFDDLGLRFEDREGGYTRIVKLAKPRLGDSGTRVILEFVGNDRDRVTQAAARPSFDSEEVTEETTEEPGDE